MNNVKSSDLREIVRILVRNLGLLERNKSCCCGVTLAQCHAIVEIGRAKEINLNSLAELLNLEKSTMSRTINNLVNESLVLREIHTENRRYIKIKLTEKGEEIFREIEKTMEDYYTDVISLVPADKREQVLESLQILVDVVNVNKCCNEKESKRL
ncbi:MULTISPECIES: MarR family winged helix-turn-helix transcriptional regulator [Clostridium]|uniref:MarR family transcriptional regulator n=1 Tax=Clostridium frigoriphilum TaxID=443253 RepID=A0ABU7UL38_9CLOT|nr:MarR family transcriptional regulator [Clostridium sp. DSM 17811]MBU3097811.1 MarR family transcriptional regulator [Clostridium sp. DSM 17811]